MKVYIASSFSNLERVKDVVGLCNLLKIDITCTWWDRKQLHDDFKGKYSDDVFYNLPDCRIAYHRDVQGIKDADLLILVATNEPKRYNGAMLECGIAVGLDKPIVVYGKLEQSAMFYPMHFIDDITSLADYIKGFKSIKDWIEVLK